MRKCTHTRGANIMPVAAYLCCSCSATIWRSLLSSCSCKRATSCNTPTTAAEGSLNGSQAHAHQGLHARGFKAPAQWFCLRHTCQWAHRARQYHRSTVELACAALLCAAGYVHRFQASFTVTSQHARRVAQAARRAATAGAQE